MEIKELIEVPLDYKEKLDMSNVKFGVEIEFQETYLDELKSKIENLVGNIKNDYTTWQVKADSTVTKIIYLKEKENPFVNKGGEVVSPILSNNEKSWQELKKICELLNKENTEITTFCGLHIHKSIDMYKEIKEYINLLKLYMLFENVIYQFACGETIKERIYMKSYAIRSGNLIQENLKKYETYDTKEKIFSGYGYNRLYGLSYFDLKGKETIEMRMFNSTLNENIIQNNILFNDKFMTYAKEENFDEEYIDSLINNPPKYSIELVDILTNLIYEEEDYKNRFKKQYYKAFKPNEIAKKHFSC